MFLKIAVLVVLVAAVWFGFRYLERRKEINAGSRKTADRTLGERLRKSMREKTGSGSDPESVEDTERCPTCEAFVSIEGVKNCGKANCPY